MNSKISKCDDKLVITLPVEVAQPLGWGVGDLLRVKRRERLFERCPYADRP